MLKRATTWEHRHSISQYCLGVDSSGSCCYSFISPPPPMQLASVHFASDFASKEREIPLQFIRFLCWIYACLLRRWRGMSVFFFFRCPSICSNESHKVEMYKRNIGETGGGLCLEQLRVFCVVGCYTNHIPITKKNKNILLSGISLCSDAVMHRLPPPNSHYNIVIY